MNVTFQESILFYDCEIMFQAADDGGRHYIAVHGDESPDGCQYIVAPASLENLAAFKAGRIGLRCLLLAAPDGEWHTATIGPAADGITLARQPRPVADCPDLLESDFYLYLPAADSDPAADPDLAPLGEAETRPDVLGGSLPPTTS